MLCNQYLNERKLSLVEHSIITKVGELLEYPQNQDTVSWYSLSNAYSGKRNKRWKKEREREAINALHEARALPAGTIGWLILRLIVLPLIRWYLDNKTDN